MRGSVFLFLLAVIAVACSSGGVDGQSCGLGSRICDGACVRVDSDNRHCGACGTVCTLSERCTEGKCTPTCGGGTASCGGACVDLSVERANCGTCGIGCAAGEVCAAGACGTSCLVGSTRCELVSNEPFCANVLTDDRNCGTCGHACAGQATCVAGTCVPPCLEGQTRCGIECPDVRTSWKHCGQCGNTCGSARQCRDFQCADTGNIVFITSTLGDGDKGGLAGADATCQALATAAGLGGTFKAWLSDDNASPDTRFTHSNKKYALVDGTVIANDWGDLTDGTLANPINLDERGNPGPQSCIGTCDLYAFTNTTMNGLGFSTSLDCVDWTSNAKVSPFSWGLGTATNGSWSQHGTAGGGCDWKLAMYCFQQ